MTFTLQSASHIDGIGAVLDGPQQVQNVDPTGTGYLDHFYIGRITEPHGTRQIAGCVCAVLAAEGDDLRLEGCIHGNIFLSLTG
jgi:hypothetical protein